MPHLFGTASSLGLPPTATATPTKRSRVHKSGARSASVDLPGLSALHASKQIAETPCDVVHLTSLAGISSLLGPTKNVPSASKGVSSLALEKHPEDVIRIEVSLGLKALSVVGLRAKHVVVRSLVCVT